MKPEMKPRVGMLRRLAGGLILTTAFVLGSTAVPALAPVSTSISYQGSLKDGGLPAHGSYDFSFSLFDAESAGTQIGSTVTMSAVVVANGLFSVPLDFGATAFDGSARWLEISVGPAGGALTPLVPRREVTPAAQARFAVEADKLDGFDATQLEKRVSFLAYHVNQFNIAASMTTLDFNTDLYDHGGNYNTTNGQFTAPEAGTYEIATGFKLASLTTNLTVGIFVNGSQVAQVIDVVGGTNNSVFGSRVMPLNAGDVVTIRRINSAPLQPATSIQHFFSVVQLY